MLWGAFIQVPKTMYGRGIPEILLYVIVSDLNHFVVLVGNIVGHTYLILSHHHYVYHIAGCTGFPFEKDGNAVLLEPSKPHHEFKLRIIVCHAICHL